jgi:hypothetical protein
VGRKREGGARGEPMAALVIEAEDPLTGWLKLGRDSKGTVRILVDAKPDPIYVARHFKLDKDHWPVVGMELPVTIDPADPEKFEIRWDEVPSMEARAAANDPTLADPVGARKKAHKALLASGAAGPAGPYAPSGAVRETIVRAQAEAAKQEDEDRPDHWEESLEQAAKEPAPPGRTRAVVLFAASEASLRTEGASPDGTGGRTVRDRHGTHATVLAVTIPGHEPYAVYKPKLKHKRGRGLALGAGIPALVSSSDPTDVEILWDELGSVKEQVSETVAEATQLMQNRMAAAGQQMEEANRMMSAPAIPAPNPANPPQAPAGTPGISPQMKDTMLKNAKMAISAAPNPQMRQMIIEQYRLAGIPIDEKGNPLK